MATYTKPPGQAGSAGISLKYLPAGVTSLTAAVVFSSSPTGTPVVYTSPYATVASTTGMPQTAPVPFVMPATGGNFYAFVTIKDGPAVLGIWDLSTNFVSTSIEIIGVVWT